MAEGATAAEDRYRTGVARWAARDLEGATRTLHDALDQARVDPEERWRGPIERALAQVAMERDQLDDAAGHLRRLPADPVGTALQLALRARRSWLAGDHAAAAVEVAAGLDALEAGPEPSELADLMNGAIALAWSADVLAELGFGDDAAVAISTARRWVDRAGHHDPAVELTLLVAEASSQRLHGSIESSSSALTAASASTDPEATVLAHRGRARLAWDRNDRVAAARHYDASIAAAEDGDYVSLARLLGTEAATGPPTRQTVPVRDLVARRWQRSLDRAVPYAVVISLTVVDDHPDAVPQRRRLVEAITARLAEHPELGHLDGEALGPDGWDLYLDGTDPEALWMAVRDLVEAAAPAPGSAVRVAGRATQRWC